MFAVVLYYGIQIAMKARSQFGRLLVLRGRVQPLERDQAFDLCVHVKKKAPPKRGLAVRARARRSCGRHSICQSVCDQQSALCKPGNAIWWAHQDSNLEQAGYEPAALTVELWARTILRRPSFEKRAKFA